MYCRDDVSTGHIMHSESPINFKLDAPTFFTGFTFQLLVLLQTFLNDNTDNTLYLNIMLIRLNNEIQIT